MSDVGKANFQHALDGRCEDPDCEIHRPIVIEDEAERMTACAWFLAGAEYALTQASDEFMANVFGDRTDRNYFLGGNDQPEHD